jgi:hypothetical protein
METMRGCSIVWFPRNGRPKRTWGVSIRIRKARCLLGVNVSKLRSKKTIFLLLLPVVISLLGVWLFFSGPKHQPATVSQAVNRLLGENGLSEEDRDWILRNPKDEVCVSLHFSLGLGIRNKFGLWGDNWRLMLSCRRMHPDDCSSVILEALCDTIRRKADPALVRRLDKQFRRAQSINIDYSGFKNITLGELIAKIQQQIEQQESVLTGVPSERVRLKVVGEWRVLHPVALDLSAPSEIATGLMSLERFLAKLTFGTGLQVRYDPPNIEIVFREDLAAPPER